MHPALAHLTPGISSICCIFLFFLWLVANPSSNSLKRAASRSILDDGIVALDLELCGWRPCGGHRQAGQCVQMCKFPPVNVESNVASLIPAGSHRPMLAVRRPLEFPQLYLQRAIDQDRTGGDIVLSWSPARRSEVRSRR